MKNEDSKGHILAFITIVLWATTYISTKILLRDFQPMEILFYRFLIGLIVLLGVYPHRMKVTERRHEVTFILAGICGIGMYYMLENIALTYTLASNVGVIITVAPFFTAILSRIFLKNKDDLHGNFYVGFVIAMIGIYFVSFNGSKVHLNPLGDILALLAAFVWACYSVLIKQISGYGYNTIQATRRTFVYGIFTMIPAMFLFGFEFSPVPFIKPMNILNIAFLGIGASALCFVTWNYAVKILGAVRTSIYIYMVPVITVLTSRLILHERLTGIAVFGAGLILVGLFISENRISLLRMETRLK